MAIVSSTQCYCGRWFRNRKEHAAHQRAEGGSQSHTLFCYVSPKSGEWVDVHPDAKPM